MDRRFLAAIGLMMLVVIAPTFLIKRPPQPATPAAAVSTVGAPDTARTSAPAGIPTPAPTALPPRAKAPQAAGDTVVVRSGLYEAALSTRGARLIGTRLLRYTSHAAGDSAGPVELVRAGDALFGAALVAGTDTLDLSSVVFTPSASEVRVAGPTPVTFTATVGGHQVTLTYTFSPDDYQVDLRGEVTGLPATGGLLLVDLGHGIRNSEADSALNARDFALVVKGVGKDPQAIPFRKPDMGEHRVEPGPMNWVAVKSKYFVIGVFAHDSAAPWAAVDMERQDPAKLPHFAGLHLSLPVAASGAFGWRIYAGPMEYPRLGAQGQGFDDVNPYGIVGIRTLIRPFALAFRALIVWMHTHLGIGYGLVLILFGVLVRVVLWPLNQKAMRSAMEMQALQPRIQDLQASYKDDPQALNQAMFALYKEHGVNPLGGCWPMLLPMPILFALFFVLQSTIEIRGVPFLWFPDLSRADPFYIIPIVSGISMFLLSRIGQRGLPRNPQTQMMLYMMPVMFTIFGFSFPSGLNLYYAASNLASIPQQWMLSEERIKRKGAAGVVVGTRK